MKNNNQINVPQAREAMDRFKMLIKQAKSVSTCRAATTPHLTSREAGDLGKPDGKEDVSRTN